MKKIGIGVGVLGVACGLWIALSGSVNSGVATSQSQASSQSKPVFDYDAASIEDRKNWLLQNAKPMATLLNRALPKGNNAQPNMSVKGYSVDARRREITMDVRVTGKYGIDRKAIPTAKKALIAQLCPSYAASPLGANKVQLNHSFVGNGGREELFVVVSPITCRTFL